MLLTINNDFKTLLYNTNSFVESVGKNGNVKTIGKNFSYVKINFSVLPYIPITNIISLYNNKLFNQINAIETIFREADKILKPKGYNIKVRRDKSAPSSLDEKIKSDKIKELSKELSKVLDADYKIVLHSLVSIVNSFSEYSFVIANKVKSPLDLDNFLDSLVKIIKLNRSNKHILSNSLLDNTLLLLDQITKFPDVNYTNLWEIFCGFREASFEEERDEELTEFLKVLYMVENDIHFVNLLSFFPLWFSFNLCLKVFEDRLKNILKRKLDLSNCVTPRLTSMFANHMKLFLDRNLMSIVLRNSNKAFKEIFSTVLDIQKSINGFLTLSYNLVVVKPCIIPNLINVSKDRRIFASTPLTEANAKKTEAILQTISFKSFINPVIKDVYIFDGNDTNVGITAFLASNRIKSYLISIYGFDTGIYDVVDRPIELFLDASDAIMLEGDSGELMSSDEVGSQEVSLVAFNIDTKSLIRKGKIFYDKSGNKVLELVNNHSVLINKKVVNHIVKPLFIANLDLKLRTITDTIKDDMVKKTYKELLKS